MATPQKPAPVVAEPKLEPQNELALKVIAARKAAEAAMPLGHGVDTSWEVRDALILIAQVHAITGAAAPDFAAAPEYVAPPEPAAESPDGAEKDAGK
jgi:hypothetical protein